MTRWRVYYDDGGTYTGDVEAAPAHGVITIVMTDPDVGRVLLTRWDYYCWHPDGQWYGHDIAGLIDCLGLPGWKRVLFGRTVPNAVYNRVHETAADDPEFPTKSASYVTERPGFWGARQ